jgi:hypothetical protein
MSGTKWIESVSVVLLAAGAALVGAAVYSLFRLLHATIKSHKELDRQRACYAYDCAGDLLKFLRAGESSNAAICCERLGHALKDIRDRQGMTYAMDVYRGITYAIKSETHGAHKAIYLTQQLQSQLLSHFPFVDTKR